VNLNLDPLNVGLIITTVITVLAGWASQRAATRSARATAKEQAELDAYTRASEMDKKTITRQNEEIDDLTNDNKQLRARNRELAQDKLQLEVAKRALVDQNTELKRQLREKK